MQPRVHIVGAGLAGLACAVKLADRFTVHLHESATDAGGRTRSFYYEPFKAYLDSGTHMALGANKSLFSFLDRINASDAFLPMPSFFPFFDAGTNKHFQLKGGLPFLWPANRLPDVPLSAYKEALAFQHGGKLIDCLPKDSPLLRPLWRPLCQSVLNAEPEDAEASLLWRVLCESALKGRKATTPYLIKDTLSESIIKPAMTFCERKRIPVHFSHTLRTLVGEERVTRLLFQKESVSVGPQDYVILAVPSYAAARFLPQADIPMKCAPITNIHYKLGNTKSAPDQFMGIIDGTAHWFFIKDNILSVTVSAADALADISGDEIALRCYKDVCKATGLPHAFLPPYKIVSDKRATLRQTPAQEKKRPLPQTSAQNLLLAGDWTDTGLPCTMEGAVRSGFNAATTLIDRHEKLRNSA